MTEKFSLLNADVIMSYRGNTPEREDNLYAVLRHFDLTYTDYTIWLMEADAAPKFDWRRLSDNKVRHVFFPNSGPFPKAMLYNMGAKLSQSQILIFNDVDCIAEPKNVRDSVSELIHFRQHDVLCPFWEMINVEGALKKRFLEDPRYELFNGIHKNALVPETSILYERNAGGIFIFRRTDFIKVGGLNMQFKGWGGEDSELLHRATRLGLRWSSLGTPLFHLNHDSPNRDGWREQAMPNVELGNQSEHMPIEQLQALADELRQFFVA
ncbi:galactosyltransferase-related protein [Hydromonas duriensis]|uniref:Galactosyltransferase-like protein n=1 Tax=Hydromonas duriensis TaxID=1527608 RepID=A0A4R6Y3B5_9BURK|nr:galactosyltransferase-related protein [Hydromonas duriensis]TDR31009.1 galactosyltransferase-like protein [Hydromonas duriensis]